MPSCASFACRICSRRPSFWERWPCCPPSCFNEMNSSHSELASQWITLLAAGMLVIQLLMVVQRMLLTNIRLFALQSLMLAAIAGIIAYSHNASHVYWVAGLTVVGKVLFLPWLLNRLVRRINIVQEIEPLFNAPTSMLICGALTLLGY